VAVSGGADSVALLHLLAACAADLRLALCVAHVDHGIHPESRAWARAVADLAARLSLPFVEHRLALGPATSETAARRARYRALRATQRDRHAAYLATAHHADDQAETVLFRLLRGSGPAGLAGIPAVGPLGLRRPLLPFPRAELAEWLTRHDPDAVPVADPANRSPAHDRGWLREAVFPVLRTRYPQVGGALVRAGRMAGEEREAWDALARTDSALALRACDGGCEVERAPFSRYDKTLSAVLLRAICRVAGGHLGAARAHSLVRFVTAAPSGRLFELGRGWRAETVFDRLRIVGPALGGESGAGPVGWGGEDAGEVRWGEWCITWRPEAAGPLVRRDWVTWVAGRSGVVRALRPGDRMRPLGGTGQRPVRRLLMEARVARPERPRHPIVMLGDEVLWIPGVCRSAVGQPELGAPAVRLDARRVGGASSDGRSTDRRDRV
jgi:tRNA(Ile)-lysidine synthase